VRSRFTLVTPPEAAEPIYLDPRAAPLVDPPFVALPGETRINVVAGFFSFTGVLCGIGASFAALTLLSNYLPLIKAPIPEALVLESTIIGAVTCAANLRTAKLLRGRKRAGAYLALIYFAISLFSVGRTGSMFTMAVGVLGVLLTATVWRWLD
jgi:hypothetical protein